MLTLKRSRHKRLECEWLNSRDSSIIKIFFSFQARKKKRDKIFLLFFSLPGRWGTKSRRGQCWRIQVINQSSLLRFVILQKSWISGVEHLKSNERYFWRPNVWKMNTDRGRRKSIRKHRIDPRGGKGQGPTLGSGQLIKILQSSKSSGQTIKARFRSKPLLVQGLSLNDPVLVRATNILARSTSN